MKPSTKLKEQLKDVAGEFGVKQELVDDIYKSIFKYQRRVFTMDNYPDLVLINWGRYEVKATSLRRYMLKFIRMYKDGRMPRESAERIISQYWKPYKITWKRYIDDNRRRGKKSTATNRRNKGWAGG